MNDKTFPLSLKFKEQHYHGKVTPSEELSSNGLPVFFRVEIGGEFFAYICCTDNGWLQKDGNDKPKDLTSAIGEYIRGYYE